MGVEITTGVGVQHKRKLIFFYLHTSIYSSLVLQLSGKVALGSWMPGFSSD